MKIRWSLPSLCSVLAAALAALAAGCATHPQQPSPRATAERTAPNGSVTGVNEPAPERPGLGTMWGNDRLSWVEPTTFNRADGNHPAAVGRIYYNDRDGTNAMLDYLGGNAEETTGPRALGDITFALRDRDGHWLRTWDLKGRRFATGDKDHGYAVVLKNTSARPVEVLVSVDGRDALDGNQADREKRGYVLDPRQEFAVEGWRRTDATVAEFRFSRMGWTYAQRLDHDTKDVGVIGVAVFRQGKPGRDAGRQPPPVHPAQPGDHPSSRQYALPPTDA